MANETDLSQTRPELQNINGTSTQICLSLIIFGGIFPNAPEKGYANELAEGLMENGKWRVDGCRCRWGLWWKAESGGGGGIGTDKQDLAYDAWSLRLCMCVCVCFFMNRNPGMFVVVVVVAVVL